MSAPLFKPVIKKALFKIGDLRQETMLLIPTKDFFKRLGKDLNLAGKGKVIPNLQQFLCLDPSRFPEFILINKLCKALEYFMGNAHLKSIGCQVGFFVD
jgi:hypothetical protein